MPAEHQVRDVRLFRAKPQKDVVRVCSSLQSGVVFVPAIARMPELFECTCASLASVLQKGCDSFLLLTEVL